MADAVVVTTLANTPTRKVLFMTNVCDTTGESAVVKADVSADTAFGAVSHYGVERIAWNVQGFTTVTLAFDATTDDTIAIMGDGSSGDIDFDKYGAFVDPQSTGATGDILLTTAGNAANDTYSILLVLRKYY